MGLGSYLVGAAAGAALNAADAKKEMKRAMKGRTPEQKKVIQYFYRSGGCLSSKMTDQEYDNLVKAKANSMDFKQRALSKLGIDESEVNEIEPVHFEGYLFDDNYDAYALYGKDRVWRSSAYEITWLFFSSTQVYLYKYIFNMDEDGKKESTEEYFYKDITNFSTVSDTVERVVPDKTSCTGKTSYARKNVDSNRFKLVVPGESLLCSMEQNDYTERAIRGMKAKLREKKN